MIGTSYMYEGSEGLYSAVVAPGEIIFHITALPEWLCICVKYLRTEVGYLLYIQTCIMQMHNPAYHPEEQMQCLSGFQTLSADTNVLFFGSKLQNLTITKKEKLQKRNSLQFVKR